MSSTTRSAHKLTSILFKPYNLVMPINDADTFEISLRNNCYYISWHAKRHILYRMLFIILHLNDDNLSGCCWPAIAWITRQTETKAEWYLRGLDKRKPDVTDKKFRQSLIYALSCRDNEYEWSGEWSVGKTAAREIAS